MGKGSRGGVWWTPGVEETELRVQAPRQLEVTEQSTGKERPGGGERETELQRSSESLRVFSRKLTSI